MACTISLTVGPQQSKEVSEDEKDFCDPSCNRDDVYPRSSRSCGGRKTAVLEPDGTVYLALIVRMPEEVANEANYRESDTPKVELGITVKADQIKE